MEKIQIVDLSEEKINYEKQAKEIILRFKKVLAFINNKYGKYINDESTDEIDIIEFQKDIAYILVEIEEVRTLNNKKDFKNRLSEFSSFIGGGIHDIRNASQFLLNNIQAGEKINISYLKRFQTFAVEIYKDKNEIGDFLMEAKYAILADIKNKLNKIIEESLDGINYEIILGKNSDGLEFNYHKTALFLLFNELATNFNKYGENPKVNIYFSEDNWGIRWENDLKKNLEENLHSTNEGTKILEKAMKALGGNVLENEVKDGIYYFKAETFVTEEY